MRDIAAISAMLMVESEVIVEAMDQGEAGIKTLAL